MRILLYEFVTGGGWYGAGTAEPPASLLAEGAAMVAALAADLAAIDGVQIDILRDWRVDVALPPDCLFHDVASARQERDVLARLAARADWSIIIAPEFDGHLAARCRLVEEAGGRLLGPSAAIVALAGDKHACARHLAARGIRVPEGVALEPGDSLPRDFNYPAVLKLRDGAGSQGVRLIDRRRAGAIRVDTPARLESYCPGMAASVACLCGSREIVALAPCRQRLSDDGYFRYLGGSLPLDAPFAARALRLAARAISTLDDARGYLGVDLVLGREASGALDAVIEINPRLTTSYVGLRALAAVNLAAAMLEIAQGREAELSWHSGPIQFEAAGRVRHERMLGGV